MRSVDEAMRWLEHEVSSGSARWSSLCLSMVANAYGLGSSGVASYGASNPTTWWNHGAPGAQSGDRNPPRGALVFWTKTGRPGHIAISAGNGQVYSTDIGRSGRVDLVSLNAVERQWGQTYEGWSRPAFPSAGNSTARGWDDTVAASSSTNVPSKWGPEKLAWFLASQGLEGETLRTAWAIAMRESGGRPGIDNAGVNANGSIDYGLFQINDKAHLAQLQSKYGWDMEDMRDPVKNLKYFLYLSDNGRNLGPWNMGPNAYDPANSAHHTQLFQEQLAKFKQYERYATGATPTSATDPGGSYTGAYDDLSQRELAEEYGFVWKVLKEDPELWDLFQEASSGEQTWTPEAFKAKLKATKWWDEHSSYYREAMADRANGGARDWQQKKADVRRVVLDRVSEIGADIAAIPDDVLNGFVRDYLYEGWGERPYMLDRALSKFLGEDNEFTGEAGTAQDELRQYAADFGIQPGDKWFRQAVEQIVSQKATIDVYKDWIKEQAKLRYPALAQQYDATGLSTKALMSPYLNDYATTLEVTPDAIGLDDRLLQKALGGRAQDGAPVLMSQYDFQTELRRDPRWKATGNGRRSAVDLYTNLLSSWGFGEGTID